MDVTPTFKKGRREAQAKQRQVSLTTIPGKVMEQIIPEAISRNPKNKKVIGNSQHGFTKSTAHLTSLITF